MKVNKQQQRNRASRAQVSPLHHPLLKGAVEKLHREMSVAVEGKAPYVALVTDPRTKAVIHRAIGLGEQEVRERAKAFIDAVNSRRVNVDVCRSALLISDRGEGRPS